MQIPSSSVVFQAYPKIPVEEFLAELQYEFEDMPNEAFPHFIMRAINKIARDSNVLRREATIHTQPCVTSYLLEPEDCSEILAIMRVCHTNHHCGYVQVLPVTRLTEPGCLLPCGGPVSWFEAPNVIHFRPVNPHDVFSVEMSVIPEWDACEVDKILLTNYYDLVMDGARSYLYAMLNKPWSSAARAQEHEKRFLLGIRQAAIETMLKGQRGALKAKRPRVL